MYPFRLLQIAIEDVSLECFLATLEYMYTDHAPIEEGDAVGILVAADQYGQDRLRNLCELYITKGVDVAVANCIAEAHVDVIGLLKTAQVGEALGSNMSSSASPYILLQ